MKYLTSEEIERLFRAVRAAGQVRDLALFEVGFHRGLRASEVGILEYRHLRLEAKRLYVTRCKGSLSAEYPLCEREVKALRAWIRDRGAAAGPLFPSRNHRPISRRRLDELMKQYGGAAELPAEKQHWHALRHSCAVELLERDIGIEIIQDHLGHKSIANTAIYARVSDKKRRQVGDRLFREW